jgi:hypothetical protein
MRLAGRLSTAALIVEALSLCFFIRPLAAADCSVQTTDFSPSWTNVFNITASGFTNTEIQAAANYWACPGYSGMIPSFQIGGTGGIPVSVVKRVGNSTTQSGSCGIGTLNFLYGQVASATIEVWTHQSDGVSCAPLSDVLAHEFGHLLGEEDAEDPFGACFGHIMGGTVESQRRTVHADDCAVADTMWQTTAEEPTEDPFCSAYCWTNCIGSVCPDGRTTTGCPILIDMEDDGIHLTGLEDPVWFDIDGDGTINAMSWTNRSDGLLAMDRNGNGAIDHGGELFGNATLLADGTRALNGYLALAELDSWIFGGNGDEFIDSTDASFTSLWIWTDLNHDGLSQPEELQTLDEAGIQRIGVQYKRSNRTDRYGNEFRFLGRAWKTGRRGAVRPMLTWDVFFRVVR